MAVDKFKSNQVINGTFGRLWVSGELYANIKSFEAKATLNWEPVNVADDLGTYQKYMGYEGAGTAVFHKVNSDFVRRYLDGIRTGNIPDVTMVGRLSDPAALGSERVEFLGVTFDELTLLKFENKTLGEEEVPFKFSGFNPIDLI